MKIPILNIYYMLLYAWDVLDEADSIDLRERDSTQLVDLFARVLHTGTEHLLRRGLDRGYLPRRETIAGVRGKPDISASIKTGAIGRARMTCEFDDFSYDVLHNQILKSTIHRLLSVEDLDRGNRENLAETYYRLHQITEIELSDQAFRSLRLHRNNRQYQLLMNVCWLIHRSGLVTEETGEREFRDFVRSDRQMRKLFERFVRKFYEREQTELRPQKRGVSWDGLRGEPDALALMPGMVTDVRLQSPSRHIVIETKFVPQMLTVHYEKKMLRSEHLYQLFAYVTNIADQTTIPVEGILLYPAVDEQRDLRFQIAGRQFRACTLNLDQPWQGIREDLLELLKEPARSSDLSHALKPACHEARHTVQD
jgi:5-methylcytosine-specific restriction enzyme subunit McrC